MIAEQWLTDGELPSNRTWEDLYTHILSQYEVINTKEVVFTGFSAFISLTKYNTGDTNTLNLISTQDDVIKLNAKGRYGIEKNETYEG